MAVPLMFVQKNQCAVMYGPGLPASVREMRKHQLASPHRVNLLFYTDCDKLHQNGGGQGPLLKDMGNQVVRMKSKANL